MQIRIKYHHLQIRRLLLHNLTNKKVKLNNCNMNTNNGVMTMTQKLGQNVMNKTFPLGLLGLLLLAKPAMATENTSLNPNLGQQINSMTEENGVISRPTLISSKTLKIALLTSLSENVNENSAQFSNSLENSKNTKPEFSIANNLKLNKNVSGSQESSLVALQPSEPLEPLKPLAPLSQDQNSIPIPVSPPEQNQQEISQPILIQSSIDPNNYDPDASTQPLQISSTKQASNFNDSQSIPIPVSSPIIQNQIDTTTFPSQSNFSSTEVRNNFHSTIHQVKSGENLNSIARSYGITKDELMKANHLDNPNLIKVNQLLTIPAIASNQIDRPTLISTRQKENKNYNSNADNFGVKQANQNIITENFEGDPYNGNNSSENQIASSIPIDIEYYNPMNKPSQGEMVSPDLPQLYPEQYLPDSNRPFKGYIWPAKGVLTSGYGWRWGRMHKGIDIAAPVGTPVFAASDGEVISAGWNSGGYGNLIQLRHFDGSITVYAHNSKIFVSTGQVVKQGQPISAMGSTGRSTGPHLHFEIRPRFGQAANPMAFLPRK